MPIKLNTASGGGVILTGANTASDKTITVPAVDATMLTDSSGVLNIGSGQVYKDASGNVGIGTSSLTARLQVREDQNGTTRAIIQNRNGSGTPISEVAFISGAFDLSDNRYAYIQSGGGSSTYLAFGTGNGATPTERARIDSSGNLLVGNTTQVWDERLLAYRTTNAVVGGFYSSSSSYTSSVIRCQTETAAGTGWYLFEGRAAGGGFQYGIRGNGTVATSDERRKKNIEPARSYLGDICKIPVVKYNWKTDADDAPKELGWLAQDVEKVFPNMVVTHHDGPNDDQEVLLLKKEVFLPMLMKCIQEQQQMIETLQAKVAALEAK